MDKDQESVASLSTAAAEAEEDRKSKDTEEQETADDVGNENLTQETLSQQLLKAARIGDANMVEQLIEKGANIHATDQDGATALMWAAKAWGGADVVQKLIENGANIHATDKDGATALIRAAAGPWDDAGVVQKLIEAGADIHATDNDGNTALFKAIYLAQPVAVKQLIQAYRMHWPTKPMNNKKGKNAVDLAKALQRNWPDEEDYNEIVIILDQAEANRVAAEKAVANKAAEENAADENKEVCTNREVHENIPPMHYAAKHGCTEWVKQLIESRNLKVNLQSDKHLKRTALHFAALNGHADVVQKLIEAGAVVDLKDGNKRAALHYAALNGHADVVKQLIEARADVNLHTESAHKHSTALMLAVEGAETAKKSAEAARTTVVAASAGRVHTTGDHLLVVKLLIGAGAKKNDKNVKGQTALHLAAKHGNTDVVQQLTTKISEFDVIDLDAVDDYGQTALMLAVENIYPNIVRDLIIAGADKKSAKNLVDASERMGRLEIVQAFNVERPEEERKHTW